MKFITIKTVSDSAAGKNNPVNHALFTTSSVGSSTQISFRKHRFQPHKSLNFFASFFSAIAHCKQQFTSEDHSFLISSTGKNVYKRK